MPFVEKFGIKAGIYIAGDKKNPDAYTPLAESECEHIWKDGEGLPCPVYISTVETPATAGEIPVKLGVEYKEPRDHPSYMKGDTRIHVVIDGVEAGCEYLKNGKIKYAKGWKNEFRGFRVGRCHERFFVFNPTQSGIGDAMKVDEEGGHGDGNGDGGISNSGYSWVMDHAAPGNAELIPMVGELHPRDPANPHAINLPPHISVVQATITVGRIHKTTEKFVTHGAMQSVGLYFPPQPDPMCLSLNPKAWRPMVGPDSPGAGPTPPKEKRGRWISSADPGGLEEDIFNTARNPATWRPIGLAAGETKKIRQAREIQFTARMHLVRFWFFIGG